MKVFARLIAPGTMDYNFPLKSSHGKGERNYGKIKGPWQGLVPLDHPQGASLSPSVTSSRMSYNYNWNYADPHRFPTTEENRLPPKENLLMSSLIRAAHHQGGEKNDHHHDDDHRNKDQNLTSNNTINNNLTPRGSSARERSAEIRRRAASIRDQLWKNPEAVPEVRQVRNNNIPIYKLIIIIVLCIIYTSYFKILIYTLNQVLDLLESVVLSYNHDSADSDARLAKVLETLSERLEAGKDQHQW